MTAADVETRPHPLAVVRRVRGWSQARLARRIAATSVKLGLGPMAAERQKVCRWERGQTVPDRRTQKCLAELLGVPVQEIYDRPWPAWLPKEGQ